VGKGTQGCFDIVGEIGAVGMGRGILWSVVIGVEVIIALDGEDGGIAVIPKRAQVAAPAETGAQLRNKIQL
jgi:hypothetical protein